MNTSEYMLNIIHEIHSEYTSAIESIDHFGHWATASTSTPPFPRRRGPRRSTLGPSPWARRIPSRAFDGCGGLAHAPEIMGPGLLVPWVPCSQTKDFQRLPTFIFSFCLGNFRLETIQISSLLISFNGVIRFSGTWVHRPGNCLCKQHGQTYSVTAKHHRTIRIGYLFSTIPESYRVSNPCRFLSQQGFHNVPQCCMASPQPWETGKAFAGHSAA